MSQTPFELLVDIERRSRGRARGFPAQEAAKERWAGIAFQVKGNLLVTPLKAVAEIITPPTVINVPGVKPWVLGIANMRGMLLPIMGLQGFLFGHNLPTDFRKRRILVVKFAGHASGLLVNAVVGLKHFLAEERSEELPTLARGLSPYVKYTYRAGEQHYALFDIASLLENKAFLNVGL